MSRLIIVSNRLPVTIKNDHGQVCITESTGGLATGIRGLHEQMQSLWVGWPGDVSRFNETQRSQIGEKLLGMRTMPVYLSQSEISRYYEGFSNGVLWPLFHYLTDKIERDAWRNWKAYAAVNRRFAQAVAGQYRPGDLVWIHDYHLALVPTLLRCLIPEARIGFFLHIPFPSSEVFRILPWREELLKGMLGADLVGFHTHSYVRHFIRAARQVLNLDCDGERLEHDDRVVRLGIFPMGVDAAHFSALAKEPDIIEEAIEIKNRCGERRLLIGIDRLDYTKGIGRRMLAIERLLEREPSLRRKMRLVQVVAPSRTQVESYARLRRELDEIVGRINGAYATVNSVPIHYIYRSLSDKELVALYKAADVMLVTPLRDGMNLVAKEFIASRTDEDGVLILSEFAGASAELAEAIRVNPYDLDSMALAVKRALTMPPEERHARMWALRRRVQTFNSSHWADTFIGILHATGTSPAEYRQTVSSEETVNLAKNIASAERLLLLLDYDGTLVPFAETPDLATPDADLKRLLKHLADLPNTQVHLLSGRTRETVERWFGDLTIGLHAEHGFWSRPKPDGEWEPLSNEEPEWKERVVPILDCFVESTPGALIEEKTTGFAWHYRMADPDFGVVQAEKLRLLLDKELEDLPVEVLPGAKVIEVRLKEVNKGVIASRLIAACKEQITVVAMGDDTTDEDIFAVLPAGGVALHVGPRPSRAQYRLKDWKAARDFLAMILEAGSDTTNQQTIAIGV